MKKLAEILRASGARLLENEPMSRHTTFRVGGPADLMYVPENEEQILQALAAAREAGIEACVVGNGSNLIDNTIFYFTIQKKYTNIIKFVYFLSTFTNFFQFI